MSEWISVKDRLPDIGERVLVCAVSKNSGAPLTIITEMSDTNWLDNRLKIELYWMPPFQYFLSNYEIIHWMPLPEPPEEVSGDE